MTAPEFQLLMRQLCKLRLRELVRLDLMNKGAPLRWAKFEANPAAFVAALKPDEVQRLWTECLEPALPVVHPVTRETI